MITPIVEQHIYLIRGYKVMLDRDLAGLYGVMTKNLNLAVRRNIRRFPDDFMFRLTIEETQNLRLQIATSSLSHGGQRYLPYVFTEHGVAMLSSVLKSQQAIEMGIAIVRAFIKLREMLATQKDLSYKIEGLEREQRNQGKNLMQLNSVISDLIKESEDGTELEKPIPIGFNK